MCFSSRYRASLRLQAAVADALLNSQYQARIRARMELEASKVLALGLAKTIFGSPLRRAARFHDSGPVIVQQLQRPLDVPGKLRERTQVLVRCMEEEMKAWHEAFTILHQVCVKICCHPCHQFISGFVLANWTF